jgi:hypothetical protein
MSRQYHDEITRVVVPRAGIYRCQAVTFKWNCYSGDIRFKPRPGHRVSWLRFCVVFLGPLPPTNTRTIPQYAPTASFTSFPMYSPSQTQILLVRGICEPIVWKMWEPRRLTILWVFTACYRDSFTFTNKILSTVIKYCDGCVCWVCK